MSVAMLTTLSVNFYMLSASSSVTPATDSSAPPSVATRPLEQPDDNRGRFRERTLVSAIMAAFQALGIGRPSASPATASTTPAASSGASDATPAPDTLEQAVNAFAHTLSALVRRPGRGAHTDGEQGDAQVHHHEGRGNTGYQGLAQRLEKLAQSLGAAPVPVATTGTPTPVADPVTPTASTDTSGLLAAFTKVLSFLPSASAPPASPAPNPGASSGTLVSATSMADKLKLFLTTLAQSLHASGLATPLTPVGSRLNLSA